MLQKLGVHKIRAIKSPKLPDCNNYAYGTLENADLQNSVNKPR